MFLARARLPVAVAFIVFFLALAAVAMETPAETVDLSAPKSSGRTVLETIPGDKFSRLRIRMEPGALRDIIYRLLDEDGFRVQRDNGLIPKDGVTLKARKKLRNVECEIYPDAETGVSVLSFEHARFGNRSWVERALEQITAELGKHDPITAAAPRDNTVDAGTGKKPVIARPNYFDAGIKDPPKKQELEIPGLAVDLDNDPGAEFVDAAPQRPKNSTSNADAAEVVLLPGQSNEPAKPAPAVRKPDGGEELFRSVQRGDVSEAVGIERIGVYLEIRWLDAARTPEEAARKVLAKQIAGALTERLLSSKTAVKLIEAIDLNVRSAQSADAAQKLSDELDAVLKESDLSAEQQASLKQAALKATGR